MSTETTQDRDALLREAVGRGIEEAWKYYNVIYEPCDPDDEARQKWVDCITEQVAAVVRRELEAPVGDAVLAIDMSVEALRQRNEKAHEMVTALCKPRGTEGSREWIMSIPARPDDDPDLVISQALNDAKRLIDRLAALAAAPREREGEEA